MNNVGGLEQVAALEVVRSSRESRLTKVANGLEIGCRRKRRVWDDVKLFCLRNWREGETFAEMGNTVAGRDLG